MEIIRVEEQPVKLNPRGIQARTVLNLPHVSIMNLLLSPGERVPAHVTPVDVLFHILEGAGTVIIGEEEAKVAAGEIVVSPANIPHAIVADSDVPMSFLVIKMPNPKDAEH